MVDSLGRPLRHTRWLVLAAKPVPVLCVWIGSSSKRPANTPSAPPASDEVVWSDQRGFTCRNDGTWDLPENKVEVEQHPPPATFWIGMTGPKSTTLGRVRKELTDFRRPVPQKEHLFGHGRGKVHRARPSPS